MTRIKVLVTPASGTHDADDAVDPYRYGWRYLRHDLAHGAQVMEQVPLTLEDVLHPQEDDQVSHSDADGHRRYLVNVLEAQLAHDPTAVVLDDVRIA